MKFFRSIIIGVLLLGVLSVPTVFSASEAMSVQVKEGEIRATPSFLGKIVAKAAYGDLVTVTEKSGSWRKVSLKDGATEGWIHNTALTSKRIILTSGQEDVQTSAGQDELALAGKGFNEQVEASYMAQNKELDYTWIDKMEESKMTPEQMKVFLAEGQVVPLSEGGVQ